jgi:DNA-3-methyladenine glycosylase I
MPRTKTRCPWAGGDRLYVEYHDSEWGVPERDARALFEKLILDGFQAGLSWITILRKREAFRRAFRGFAPTEVARFSARDVGIVRNRAKIEATIDNARAYLALQKDGGFAPFVWQFVGGAPRQNRWRFAREVPAETDESRALSRALRERGFRFVGPTIVYAWMQACGLVNDHLVACFRWRALKTR